MLNQILAGLVSIRRVIRQIARDFGWRAIPLLLALALIGALLWFIIVGPMISPFVYSLL